MSTPISAIAEDVDMHEIDNFPDDDDILPEDEYEVTPKPKNVVKKKSAGKYLERYQNFIVLFLSAMIALKIPLDVVRQQTPRQLFIAGDVPVRALIILVSYVAAQQLVKNLLQ